MTSKTHGILSGTVSSGTTYTGLASVNTVCGGNPSASCLATNKTVSVDATIGLDGTISVTEVDFIDDPSVDEIEGVIYETTTPGTFGMIVSDVVNASGNSALNNVVAGFTLDFTLDQAGANFAVDTRNLGAVVSGGFSSAADLVTGQQVMIHVESTNTNGGTFNVVTDRLALRYSRFSAAVSVAGGGNQFSITPPAFLGLIGTPQVQTFPGITVFDGVTDISGVTTGDNVSIRAKGSGSPIYRGARFFVPGRKLSACATARFFNHTETALSRHHRRRNDCP